MNQTGEPTMANTPPATAPPPSNLSFCGRVRSPASSTQTPAKFIEMRSM